MCIKNLFNKNNKEYTVRNNSAPVSLVPPDDLPPAISGCILSIPGIGNFIAATVFDLANRGVIRFEQEIESGIGKLPIIFRIKNEIKYPFEQLVLDEFSSPDGKKLKPDFNNVISYQDKFKKISELDAYHCGFFTKEPSKYLGFYKLTEKGYQVSDAWVIYYRQLKDILDGKKLLNGGFSQWNGYLPYASILDKPGKWSKVFSSNNLAVPNWYTPLIVSIDKKKDVLLSNQELLSKYFIQFVDRVYDIFYVDKRV